MKPDSSQQALPLKTRHGWGGARQKAGRKAGKKPSVRHRSRAHFRQPLPAHVTMRMRRDVPSLRTVPIVHAIEKSLAVGCRRPGFRVVHYSLQGNHAHLIVEAHDREALGRGMKAIGARLARAVNRVARRKGPVLADRYHAEMLPTPRQVHHALRYVLLNARHHSTAAATPAKQARLDPASSARWFEGWRPDVPISPDDVPGGASMRPVAQAKTWLLSVGWRRRGLLDPRDVPG